MTEMLVTVTGFGSVWRRRFGKNQSDPRRFARAAYFNTTGVQVDGKVRTRPRIVGHVRFNSVGGFDPNYPLRMINSVFECAEPCIWHGQNKVLFKRMLSAPSESLRSRTSGCGVAGMEVGGHAPDFLQRVSQPTGGDAVDADQ